MGSVPQEKFLKMSIERASSAKVVKNKQPYSVPAFVGMRFVGTGEKERFTTMYSQDFDGTYAPPSESRPTSANRRNNPHPSKQFMVWKVPSRETGMVPYEKGIDMAPEYTTPDFNEMNDLLGGLRHPPTQATSTDYGAYLCRRNLSSRQGGRSKPMRVGNVLLGRVVTDGKKDALTNWLEGASLDEQHTILRMLKAVDEEKIKQTILSVMKPEAAHAVRGWLKGADDTEKEVALRLFSSLGSHQASQRIHSHSLEHLDMVRPQSRNPVPPPPRPPFSAMGSNQSMRIRRASAPPSPLPVDVLHQKSVRDHLPKVLGRVIENAPHFNTHPECPGCCGGSEDSVH